MAHRTVRRVVTGQDAEGRARVVDDRAVEPITSALLPGCAAYRLWGRDDRPTLPDAGAPPRAEAYYPPPGGSRFMINTIAPGELVPPPGLDYVMVVSGEVTLELDDGERTTVRAGDVVVQNGTRHAWHNHGTGPCTIVGVAVGADRLA